MDRRSFAGLNSTYGGLFYRGPKFYDLRVSLAPALHNIFFFLLAKSHTAAAHCFQGCHSTTIAQRQYSDLSFLSQFAILAVFLDGAVKHLPGGSAVNIATIAENV